MVSLSCIECFCVCCRDVHCSKWKAVTVWGIVLLFPLHIQGPHVLRCLCQCLQSNQAAPKLQLNMLITNHPLSLYYCWVASYLEEGNHPGSISLQNGGKEWESHSNLLFHFDNAKIRLIWVWCYATQGDCLPPASTEISSVLWFSKQVSLEHPVLRFWTIRMTVKMVWVTAINLSEDQVLNVDLGWGLLMTEGTC